MFEIYLKVCVFLFFRLTKCVFLLDVSILKVLFCLALSFCLKVFLVFKYS